MTAPLETGPLGLARMLQYASGQAGAQVIRDTPTVLLPVFMATMLGVSPWLAGLAVLIPKLWIIVCDPLVGSWSDRLATRRGRTPFLLAGAPLAALAFALLFAMRPLGSEWATAAAMSALYLLMATAYSLYLVPYLALAAELTPDPQRRTVLLAWRIVATMVGVIAGVGFAQPVIGWMGGGSAGWQAMGQGFGVLALLAMLGPLPAAGAARAARAAHGTVADALPFGQQMRAAWANRSFRTVLASSFLQGIGQATSYAAVGLVFVFVLGDVRLLIPFILALSAGSMLSQPLWVRLAWRLGQRRVLVLAALGWVLMTLSWWLLSPLRPDTPRPWQLPLLGALSDDQFWTLCRAPLIGVLNSGFVLMLQALFTDVVARDSRQAGRSTEGALTGVFSAAEKLAYAVGPAIAGAVMSLSGFQASQGGAVGQQASATAGILLNFSLIPALFVLASLWPLRRMDR